MAIKHKYLDYILFCNADFIIQKIQKCEITGVYFNIGKLYLEKAAASTENRNYLLFERKRNW